jgi:hypothetical protein
LPDWTIANGKQYDFRLFKESKIQMHPAITVLADQGLQKIHFKTQMPKKRTEKKPLKKEEKKQATFERLSAE